MLFQHTDTAKSRRKQQGMYMKLFSNKIKAGVIYYYWFIDWNKPLCNCLTGNKERTDKNTSLSLHCLSCLSIRVSFSDVHPLYETFLLQV